MKRTFKSIMFVAAAAMAFTACNIEPVQTPEETAGTHTVKFVASQVDTKTTMEINGGVASFAWEDTDKAYFHIFENGVGVTGDDIDAEIIEGVMNISAVFPDSSAPYTYTGFMAATVSNDNPSVSNEQKDLGAYDPKSDILVAKPVTDKTPEDIFEGILFQFKRVVAINQMTLKGLTEGETVTGVTITSDKPIAGEYDFANGAWNASETSISITAEAVANTDGQAVVYFVCAPVEDAQLTITATTSEDKTYSKVLAKTISFTEGGVKAFGVTVEAEAVEPIEVKFGNLGYESWGKTESFSGTTYDSVTQTVDNVCFDYVRKEGSCYANTTSIRFYKANELTFTAPDGYYITKIEWTGSAFKDDVTTNVESCTSATNELSWEGAAYSVTFTRPSSASSYITLSSVCVTIVPGEIEIIAVTGVELDKKEITLTVGETETLSAIIAPDNANNKSVTWSSDKESVATVENGVVTAKAAGTATITVTTVDGGFTASCDVTVNAAPVKVYSNLAALIADGEPTEVGTPVTVTLTDEVIESIFVTSQGYRNGVFLKVPETDKKIEIYSRNVPAEWETFGKISGTLENCTWKKFNNTTWELCPDNWDELEYTAPVKYNVVVLTGLTGGSISADKTEAPAGATVTLTATPTTGYQFVFWSVKDASENDVTVTDNAFTMPASDVTVSATFEQSEGVGAELLTTKLENADIVAGTGGTSYGECSATDANGFVYKAIAIKNFHSKATNSYYYWQIKKDSSTLPNIQLPEFPGAIKTITITVSSASKPMSDGGNTSTVFFSSSKSTSATGTGVVSGTGSDSITIDASSLGYKTGYITASGAVRIWDIEVEYYEK